MTEITVILSNPPTAIDYVSHTEADVVNLAGTQLRKWLTEGTGVGVDVKCEDQEIRKRVIERLDFIAGEVMSAYRAEGVATSVTTGPDENTPVAKTGNRKQRRAQAAQTRDTA